MHLDQLIAFIEQYGYFALFFSLWLGIIGAPIPDELIVMTGGLVSSFRILQAVPAFIVIYLGVISGLSIGYILGRMIGAPILQWLQRKKKLSNYVEKSKKLLSAYGSFALVISYALPFIRHLVPYLVGVNKMPFARYALCPFSAGLVWTFIYFILGRLFGSHIDVIAALVYRYGWIIIMMLGVVAGIGFIINYRSRVAR